MCTNGRRQFVSVHAYLMRRHHALTVITIVVRRHDIDTLAKARPRGAIVPICKARPLGRDREELEEGMRQAVVGASLNITVIDLCRPCMLQFN